MTITTHPGVYIEEDASLSLSISNSPTAIPVFIGKFFKKDGSQPTKGSCIRITSWLDFISQFSLSPAVSVKATSKSENSQKTYTYVATVTATSLSAFAIQHYFNNGGGVCYLLPLEASSSTATAELAALPEVIEKQQEITLLVCSETDTTLVNCTKQAVYDAVNSLLQQKVGYFLIADSKNETDKPNTQPDKTAVYYPNLETSFTYSQPADAHITLSGYDGIDTLAALKTASPDEHTKAKKAVDDVLKTTKITLPQAPLLRVFMRQLMPVVASGKPPLM